MSAGKTNRGRLRTDSLTRLHWAGIVLALLTGIIHLALGIPAVPSALGISFVFAGIGFFVGVALVVVDYRRQSVYLIGIPFVGVQFVLYFVLNWPDVWNPGGIGDKFIQAALILVLVLLYRRT